LIIALTPAPAYASANAPAYALANAPCNAPADVQKMISDDVLRSK